MECRNALLQAQGDWAQAVDILKQRGLARAEAKKDRQTLQGLVEAYIHPGGKVGAIIEVNCETDFVARTDEFKALVHDLALQVTAAAPRFISPPNQEAPADNQEDFLLLQPFIKDPSRTVADLIKQTIAQVGENILVRRFARFELGHES